MDTLQDLIAMRLRKLLEDVVRGEYGEGDSIDLARLEDDLLDELARTF